MASAAQGIACLVLFTMKMLQHLTITTLKARDPKHAKNHAILQHALCSATLAWQLDNIVDHSKGLLPQRLN